MGAESSSMKDFTVGQPYFSNSESAVKVTVSPATNQVENKKYTVFQYPKDNGKLDDSVEKHLEVLRTTRHPYILKHVTIFNESRQSTLITEHVIPLDVAIERQERDEIFIGLFNILDAIIFLHDRSNICHNGISVSSVFVADNGDWKLAAFEASNKAQRLAKQSYHTDVIGFGEFALSVLEYLKDDGLKTKAFMKRLQEEFINEKQEVIGSLKSLREDKFFRFPLMGVIDGLKNLPLKSSKEKEQFFNTLEEKIHVSSSQVVCRKCVPLLFSNTVLLEPHAQNKFLKCLFSSGSEACMREDGLPLFDEEYFVKYCLPCINELFKSRDTMIRLILMKYLPLYVDCIDKQILQDEILPEILSGLQESNDEIISVSFQALSNIVPILGGEAVVGSPGQKIFFDQTPDFSRAEQFGEHFRPAKSVSDVMSSKLSTKSPTTKVLHSDNVSDEKRLKRLEREKQREEQRKKREERRKQREEQKSARVQKQTSDDASTKWNSDLNETDTSQYSHHEDDVTQQQETLQPSNNHTVDEENHSEPDWEGFEAFSNHGSDDSEPKIEGKHRVNCDYSMSFSQQTADTRNDQTTANFHNEDDAWGNWGVSEPEYGAIDDFESRETFESNRNIRNDDCVPDRDSRQVTYDEPVKLPPPKSKGLSLSGIKKIASTHNKEKNDKQSTANSTTTTTKTNNKNKNNSLGEEYDIKINTSVISVSEPDYFADMIPSFEDISKNTVKIERKSEVSSKFNAVPETNSEDAAGWDDDAGGWGTDEDF